MAADFTMGVWVEVETIVGVGTIGVKFLVHLALGMQE